MTQPRGFIALTSAVIIAALLLVVTTAGSMAGLYERGILLDRELKERSFAAAASCASKAMLYLQRAGYLGGRYALNTLDECYIGDIHILGTVTTFKVQATSSKSAVTNLLVSYIPATSEIVSWQEIPTY